MNDQLAENFSWKLKRREIQGEKCQVASSFISSGDFDLRIPLKFLIYLINWNTSRELGTDISVNSNIREDRRLTRNKMGRHE